MGIYRPPSAPQMALEEIGNLMSSFAFSKLTVLGDLNLNWLSECSARLKELCLELNLTQLINFPTRPNSNNSSNSSLIDLILTNRPFKYPNNGVFAQRISNFKIFDEKAFLHYLFCADLYKICLIPDPELAFNQFFHVSNSLTEKHAPYKRF